MKTITSKLEAQMITARINSEDRVGRIEAQKEVKEFLSNLKEVEKTTMTVLIEDGFWLEYRNNDFLLVA